MALYLLDCPLCGKPAELKFDTEGAAEIQCASDATHAVKASGINEREAVLKWNRRPR